MNDSPQKVGARRGASALVLLSLLLLAPGASAATLQTLFDGNTLTVGGLRFSDWNPSPGTSASIDPTLIEVLPLLDDPQNPGIEYRLNGEMVVPGTGILDLNFGFRVLALSGQPDISGATLTLDGHAAQAGGGLVLVRHEARTNGDAPLGGFREVQDDRLADLLVLESHVAFTPQVEVLMQVAASVEGAGPTGQSSLDQFSQRFGSGPTVVPLPGAVWLLGGALAAAGVFSRRRG